jgi:hypothetical protein
VETEQKKKTACPISRVKVAWKLFKWGTKAYIGWLQINCQISYPPAQTKKIVNKFHQREIKVDFEEITPIEALFRATQ